MKYLSLCSGIEAATQAWHPLGWVPVAFSEIDRFPSAVLAHHYPTVPNWGDMTKFQEWPDAVVDVLVGGTPCQSFSVAGLRRGLADPRGNLMLTYLAIAARYRPRWLVWENVPGVLSSNGGRDFGSFLGGLGECGYGFAYRVLDAQYVRTHGLPFAVPQRRRRVFVVGYLGDWRRAAAVLIEPEGMCGHPPPRRRAGKRVAHDVAGSLVSIGRGVERAGDPRGQDPVVGLVECSPVRSDVGSSGMDMPGLRARKQGGDVSDASPRNKLQPDDMLGVRSRHDKWLIPPAANPLTARMHKGVNTTMDEVQTMVAHALRGEGFDASEDGTGRGTPIVPVAPTLRAGGNSTGGDRPYGTDADTCDSMIPVAIQERAISENPDAGPGGVGVRQDGAAYTLEARQVPQAVAFDTTQITSPGNYSSPVPGGPCHPLAAGAHAPAIAFAQNQRDEIRTMDAAGALAAEPGMKQQTYLAEPVSYRTAGDGGVYEEGDATAPLTTATDRAAQILATGWMVRRLTPRECERLQGFPEDFTRIPYRGKPADACPDGPRYKALGNSMAVNCMEWIGEQIARVEAL